MREQLSKRKYNCIIGSVILYGLIINALMVVAFSATCVEFVATHPWVFIIGYLVCAFGGIALTTGSDNPFISFIGYNLVVIPMGCLLAAYIPSYGPNEVFLALGQTCIIVFGMTALGIFKPELFDGLGVILAITLGLSFIVELISICIFGYNGVLIDKILVVVFTLYVGYDWSEAQSRRYYTLDNAIDVACNIYIDIINLFIRLLSSSSKSKK